MPKVSVIIPVYNEKKYIDQCLESVIAQTFEDIEIILVDDGSTDGCSEICDIYAEKDGRIRVIHQPNAGVSVARNTGIDAAEAEWIMFVDSDDWLEPDMVEILLRGAEGNCDLAAVSYYINEAQSQREAVPQIIKECRFSSEEYREYLLRACFLNAAAGWAHLFPDEMKCGPILSFPSLKLYRKELLDKYGLRFPVGISLSEDKVFNLNYIARAGSVYFINNSLYHYRYHRTSATHRSGTVMANAFLKTARCLNGEIKALGIEDEVEKFYHLNNFNFAKISLNRCAAAVHSLKELKTACREYKAFLSNPLIAESVDTVNLKDIAQKKNKLAAFILKKRLIAPGMLIYMLYNRKKSPPNNKEEFVQL